ncbi:EamA family transporter [Pantoea sp. Z09]|uniref:EamA family transporter n=1 Tax=Pantoea sp. Z09 TaxID=2886821 RepID=UPI001EFDBE24|nr:EamA family transporter [Pantoea sp. Z09]
MKVNHVTIAVLSGVIFCVISAAFDVFVANLTQKINPVIFIIYCFFTSTIIFSLTGCIKQRSAYFTKAKKNFSLLSFINAAVLLNWGGLIISLKYLEPAIVGIASVACGPALTIVISRNFMKNTSASSKTESVIAWTILTGVIVMLINSYIGRSGFTTTSFTERAVGILCVICSATGTVLYTFFSKNLNNKGWSSSEILGFRNILMLALALAYSVHNHIPLIPGKELLLTLFLVSIIGHVIPIFLVQKTISALDPIHVSLLLLLLPVFTLAFQLFDERIIISIESIYAVFGITLLLTFLCFTKLTTRQGEN